jgi:hypothetical protein
MKQQSISGDTAQTRPSRTSGDAAQLQAAHQELFWFCYRNHLDPSAVLVEAWPPAEVD